MALLRIDARGSQELSDLITVLAKVEKPVASQIRRQSRAVIIPEWKRGLTEHASTRMEVRAISDTSTANVSDRNVTLMAGATKGRFSGGFDPRRSIKAVEFGANRGKTTTYRARRKKSGHSYNVTRHTQAQFRPNRREGYVAYPTASDLIPRIARLWIQTAVRELHEQFESVTGK